MWRVRIEKAAGRRLLQADKAVFKAAEKVVERLRAADDPRKSAKALHGPLAGYFRIVVRKDWRILFSVSEAKRTIDVVDFGKRSDIYREARRRKRR